MRLTSFAGVGTVTLDIDGKKYEADSIVIDLDETTRARVRIRGMREKRRVVRKARNV